MGEVAVVQKLIEILTAFYTERIPLEEDLNFSITSEFLLNLKGVLFTKQLISKLRWESYFKFCYYEMRSTPEMYLRYVIYACRQCSRIHPNIFERFLGVLAIILHFRVVEFGEPAVNFSELIPDTFMGIFEIELKKPFKKYGGLRRFVEYINDTKYLASNVISKASKVETLEDLDTQVRKAFSKEKQLPENFRLENAQNDWSSVNLAQKILKKSKFELPSSPSNVGLKKKLTQQLKEQLADEKTDFEAKTMCFQLPSTSSDVMKTNLPVLPQQMLGQSPDKKVFEAKGMSLHPPSFFSDVMKEKLPVLPQQMLGKLAEEVLQASNRHLEISSFSSDADVKVKLREQAATKAMEVKESALKIELDRSLKSDSETNVVVEQMKDTTHQENIIQAAIRHNRSISLDQANQNKYLQKEACDILDKLKSKIETITELLNEYDKE